MSNHFVITGIPRSGTSLLCRMMNALDNVACFNEIVYEVPMLPAAFSTLRTMLLLDEAVPNKNTTDAQTDRAGIEWARVEKPVDKNVTLGLKANVPFLTNMPQIMGFGYKIIAVIRDPMYTIGSWNLPKCANINEHDVRSNPRYEGFPFKTHDRFNCQAEIWNHFAELMLEHSKNVIFVKYESLTEVTSVAMDMLTSKLGLKGSVQMPVRCMNDVNRYPHIEEIRQAVSRYAPAMKAFGYTV